MGVHNNVHIPEESWPKFTWYAIEFGILLAVSMLISREIVNSIPELAPDIQNWVFYGIVGGFFVAWYMIVRPVVFKKRILETRY